VLRDLERELEAAPSGVQATQLGECGSEPGVEARHLEVARQSSVEVAHPLFQDLSEPEEHARAERGVAAQRWGLEPTLVQRDQLGPVTVQEVSLFEGLEGEGLARLLPHARVFALVGQTASPSRRKTVFLLIDPNAGGLEPESRCGGPQILFAFGGLGGRGSHGRGRGGGCGNMPD
jgi:hypothetical protein